MPGRVALLGARGAGKSALASLCVARLRQRPAAPFEVPDGSHSQRDCFPKFVFEIRKSTVRFFFRSAAFILHFDDAIQPKTRFLLVANSTKFV